MTEYYLLNNTMAVFKFCLKIIRYWTKKSKQQFLAIGIYQEIYLKISRIYCSMICWIRKVRKSKKSWKIRDYLYFSKFREVFNVWRNHRSKINSLSITTQVSVNLNDKIFDLFIYHTRATISNCSYLFDLILKSYH